MNEDISICAYVDLPTTYESADTPDADLIPGDLEPALASTKSDTSTTTNIAPQTISEWLYFNHLALDFARPEQLGGSDLYAVLAECSNRLRSILMDADQGEGAVQVPWESSTNFSVEESLGSVYLTDIVLRGVTSAWHYFGTELSSIQRARIIETIAQMAQILVNPDLEPLWDFHQSNADNVCSD